MGDAEVTTPTPSRWDQQGAEYVRSNEEWVARFSRELVLRWPSVSLDQAFGVAQELSLNDRVRALSPEKAASDMVMTR